MLLRNDSVIERERGLHQRADRKSTEVEQWLYLYVILLNILLNILIGLADGKKITNKHANESFVFRSYETVNDGESNK